MPAINFSTSIHALHQVELNSQFSEDLQNKWLKTDSPLRRRMSVGGMVSQGIILFLFPNKCYS